MEENGFQKNTGFGETMTDRQKAIEALEPFSSIYERGE